MKMNVLLYRCKICFIPIGSSPSVSSVICRILVLSIIGANLAPDADAQKTCGALLGQVFDPSGKNLMGAKVTITNVANGNGYARATNKDGYYRHPCLTPGNYRITASKQGYLEVSINFPIQLNQKNVIEYPPDITLKLVTLTGRVIDQAGNGSLAARITVVDQRTGDSQVTVSDPHGNYIVSHLSPGSHIIRASSAAATHEAFGVMPIQLDSENVAARPLTLIQATNQNPSQAGGPASDRSAVVQLVHTVDPARSTNFTQQEINSLPLGGATYIRSFDELALLAPGVAPPPFTPGARGPGVGFGVGTAGEFSVNGMRARSNNFTIDGSDNNDPDVGVRRQGFVALVPQSLESINDLSISTLLWDAELGRNFGSQVNAVSKYGANAYHGQAYLYFTDSRLNARNFFDYAGGPSGDKDPFTRTQAGFAVGGPIVRGRTQLFGSFEHVAVNASTEQHFASPALADRRFLGAPRFGVLNPLPESNPSALFDTTLGTAPLGRNILAFYPEPNNSGGPYGSNTYSEILPASGGADVFSFKVTHRLGESAVVNARYNFTDDDRVLPSVNRAIHSTLGSDTRTQNLSLILDSDLGARFFSQSRFSYGRTRLNLLENRDSPFIFKNTSVERVQNNLGGPSMFISETGPIGELLVEPFSPVGIEASTFPQKRVDNAFQFADTVFATWSNHSVKFGGDVRRVQLNSRLERNYRPQVVYGNAVLALGNINLTGDPDNPAPFVPALGSTVRFVSGLELATVGLPSSIFQTITSGVPDATIGLRVTEYGFFINDNWRARANLSFDYGLRYEYNTVPREVNDRIESAIGLKDLPAPGGSSADTPERTAAFNNSVNAYRQVLAGRTRIYEPDRNNFGPHIGFAWAPWSTGNRAQVKTVIRGGYGIYFDAILGAVVSQSRNVFPSEVPLNVDPTFLGFDVFGLRNPSFIEIGDGRMIPLIAPGTLNQLGGARGDFAALIGDLFLKNQRGGGLAFTLPSKNLRTPYAQQWHLTLEREIFGDYLISAAYIGTKGTKLTRLTTPNLGPSVTIFIPVATGFTTSANPNPRPLEIIGLPPFLIAARDAQSQRLARPNAALGPYRIFENSAGSNYHSLQLEMEKRYSRGYVFTLAYTWSHAIDDVSDIFPIAGAPLLAQDSFNHQLERASASFDVRHRFVTSLVWDLPFYRGVTGRKARWLGGWQLAWVFQANTGQPFTLNVPADANLDGNLTDRPSTTEGLIFFRAHGPRRVALAPGSEVTNFFSFDRDGFVGRNTARGDSYMNWDLSMNKSFPLGRNQDLELRAEFFNVLNRANFGIPIRTIGAPGFGSAVDTVNPARITQLALKYSF